ncbi:MAG TPA: hypothetical protein VME20_07365 [Acidimicrobiales bacterium]|nr:hypothetical protein [Acidimicrobiales bacterium]
MATEPGARPSHQLPGTPPAVPPEEVPAQDVGGGHSVANSVPGGVPALHPSDAGAGYAPVGGDAETGVWDFETDGYEEAYAAADQVDQAWEGPSAWAGQYGDAPEQEQSWYEHQQGGWSPEEASGAGWYGEGYPDAGYHETGYDQGAYEEGAYEQGAYEQGGYAGTTYHEGTYGESGYDQGGYGDAAYAGELPGAELRSAEPSKTSHYVRPRQDASALYKKGGTAQVPRVWDEGAMPSRRRSQKERGARPSRSSGPWPELAMITAVAVVVAAVILAVTSADQANHNGPKSLQTTSPATSPAGGKATKPKGGPTTKPPRPTTALTSKPTTSAPRSTTTGAASASRGENLVVTAGVKESLISSWLETNPGGVGLVARDVAGTVPGAVYYGEQRGNPPVYWAIAAFEPSAALLASKATAAGQTALAQFQDSDYVFSWKSGPYWTEIGYVSSGECPGSYVPTAMLAAWGLCGQ